MFFAHETHDVVEPVEVTLPHVEPYWDWIMTTRIVLKLMSRTRGTSRTIGTATPNKVIPFASPVLPFFPSAMILPSVE